MRSIWGLLALLFACSAFAKECPYQKGEERWEIKTSLPKTNGPAELVDLGSLIALKNPALPKAEIHAIEEKRWDKTVSVKKAGGGNATLHEGDLVTVSGYLYRARCQPDGDFHLEIGTSKTRQSNCLIVETPDPSQI